MTSTLKEFLQEVTYWPPLRADGAGGIVTGAAELIHGHYEESIEQAVVDGIQFESSGMLCYIDQDLSVGGLILVGNHTGLSSIEEERACERARRIVKFVKIPGVIKSFDEYERVAYV